ncbi:MAG: hypothetical protein IKA10_08815 [Oscillospiraceae bacterium]|nr:hypothetical protein [Oscillospiraceae bacterium]
MKHIKTLITALLCAVSLVMLCSCSSTPPPAENNSEQVRILPDIGICLSDVVYANNMYTLLSEYGTVTATTDYPEYQMYENFFMHNDRMVNIYGETGRDDYYGLYDIYSFAVTDSEVDATVDLEWLNSNNEVYQFSTAVNGIFEGADVTVLSADENTIILSVVQLNLDYTVELDRNSLVVKKVSFTETDGTECIITYSFGKDVKGQELLDRFDNDTKAVTVISDIYGTDSYSHTEKTLHIPANWNINIYSQEEIRYYADAGFTIPFTHSTAKQDSYSIYITNSLG